MDCKSKLTLNTQSIDKYTDSFIDMTNEMEYIFCNSINDIDYSFCVLCGVSKNNHSTTHRFICSKEHHRCIECGKFFFQHSHINSCYQPQYPVQIDER